MMHRTVLVARRVSAPVRRAVWKSVAVSVGDGSLGSWSPVARGISACHAIGGVRRAHLPPHSTYTRLTARGEVATDSDGETSDFHDRGDAVGLLLGWVGAKQHQVERNYARFFHERGIPTVTVLPQREHVLRPPRAVSWGKEVLKFLSDHPELDGRRVVVYGFSVGAYTYSQFLAGLAEDPSVFDRSRFAGAVWDSPVDWQGVKHGLPRAMTNSVPIQKAISAVMNAFLSSPAGAKAVADHKTASERFHAVYEHMDVPSLVIYCDKGDPIADSEPCETVTDKWKNKGGMDVEALRFDRSAHVQHLRKHRDAYETAVRAFLDKVVPFPEDSD